MKKKEAIEFAKSFNWTEADAKRAFINIDFKKASRENLLIAMANFAGLELLERQRLQAAQKAQVTKKKNYIKKIELEFAETVEAQEQKISEMRSAFLPVIFKLYQFGQSFGLKDHWIEALMVTYKEYQQEAA